MLVVLKLKTEKGYKYISIHNMNYFEPYGIDDTKTKVFMNDGKELILYVDSEIFYQEISEVIEGIVFGEIEETEEKKGKPISN